MHSAGSFALYSVGLLYGRVAIVILMFYLTPIWSTLIAHYVMGWATPRLRLLAILVGIAGLGLVLGGGSGPPVPRDLGDWLGLISGVCWAVASTGIRLRADTGPGESVLVFVLGACLGAAVLAPNLEPPPNVPLADFGSMLSWVLTAIGIWWGLSMVRLMWATARLEPTRVGILLMAEAQLRPSTSDCLPCWKVLHSLKAVPWLCSLAELYGAAHLVLLKRLKAVLLTS